MNLTTRTPNAEISVDPDSGDVLVQTPLGEARFTRAQVDAIQEAFVRPVDTTVELSAAARYAVLAQMPCTVPGCGATPSVATDSNGAPRCWDHEQEALTVSKPWMGGDCS